MFSSGRALGFFQKSWKNEQHLNLARSLRPPLRSLGVVPDFALFDFC